MSPLVRRARAALFAVAASFVALPALHAQQLPDSARLERLKVEALTKVDGRAKMVQEIVDRIASCLDAERHQDAPVIRGR